MLLATRVVPWDWQATVTQGLDDIGQVKVEVSSDTFD